MITLTSLSILLTTLLSSILITPVQSAAITPSGTLEVSSDTNTDSSFATAAQPRLSVRPGWNPLWGLGPVIPPPGALDKLAVNNDSEDGEDTDPDMTSPSDSTDASSNSNLDSDSDSVHGAHTANGPATSAVGKNGIDANDLI